MGDLTRKPKPPPFPVGTKLRCVRRHHPGSGTYAPAVKSPRDIAKHPEDWVRISGEGLEVEISEVKPGRQGTGRQLNDEDGPMTYEDSGEPILDETRDGYSVYHVVSAAGERHGRIVHYADRKDWKVLP